jgi:protein phosphatase
MDSVMLGSSGALLELVAVPARQTYYEPVKPFLPPEDAAPGVDEQRPAFVLDVDDVVGKRIDETRLTRTVTVRQEYAAAALEVMSRFAIDPRWLVFLPPAMSPPATSKRAELLEHPGRPSPSTARTACRASSAI